MPRRPTRSVPVVIVPGWEGSGPDHWQTWLTGELAGAGRDVRLAQLPDLDHPQLPAWLGGLRSALADLPADGFDVVTHSLGAVLWLHHCADTGSSPRPARVALVAPPSPDTKIEQIASFFPPPLDIDSVRRGADGTVLVAADDDQYIPEGVTAAYGLPLKIATTVVPGGGHLNSESGYGPWPAMLDWCNRDNLAFF